MIVRFYNLGKIKETELDLRPMTVIIGPNNSNKTYIAYSIYGLWQALRGRLRSLPGLKSVRQGLNTYYFPFDQKLAQSFRNDHEFTVSSFSVQLPRYFQDKSEKLFETTWYEVVIANEELDKAARDVSYTYNVVDNPYKILSIDGGFLLKPEVDEVFEGEVVDDVTASLLVNNSIRNSLFCRPFLLPAERNAFIITYKVLADRRFKLLRDAQYNIRGHNVQELSPDLLGQSDPVHYPKPVEDFLDFLSDVETSSASRRVRSRDSDATRNGNGLHKNESDVFLKLADLIETSLQNGNKTRYRPTALGGQEIVTNVEKGLDIDLYNASSSIKQLAPLLLYLRYRAKKNDLLIIDEPEMNLHPESQAKLLEILAILVNNGINVLMTTHSPYLLAHLNNLAQTGEPSAATKRRQAKSLYLNNPDAFLSMEQVSAYEMKDAQLKSLKDEDYGIRWDTLSDVSVDLQQKYFEIYEEGHGKERAKSARKTAKTSGE